MLGIVYFTLTGCTKPEVVKQYEPVEIVREVVVPIPATYTAPIQPPQWPDDPLIVKDLANQIQAWKDLLKCKINPDRAHVAALSDGKAGKVPDVPEGCEK